MLLKDFVLALTLSLAVLADSPEIPDKTNDNRTVLIRNGVGFVESSDGEFLSAEDEFTNISVEDKDVPAGDTKYEDGFERNDVRRILDVAQDGLFDENIRDGMKTSEEVVDNFKSELDKVTSKNLNSSLDSSEDESYEHHTEEVVDNVKSELNKATSKNVISPVDEKDEQHGTEDNSKSDKVPSKNPQITSTGDDSLRMGYSEIKDTGKHSLVRGRRSYYTFPACCTNCCPVPNGVVVERPPAVIVVQPYPQQQRPQHHPPPHVVFQRPTQISTWKGWLQGCMCHKHGSVHERCDIVTGHCQCKANVEGPKCAACKVGYWDIGSGYGCRSCGCDPLGSTDGSCDELSGECLCKPGVGGITCDRCAAGYYGMSARGCSPCEPCGPPDRPGHVCDPDTGRCVCPRGTTGPECGQCTDNGWDPRPGLGCRDCDCHSAGSTSPQCDTRTGRCQCKPGFAGDQCHKCAEGYYGFPYCRRCQCDIRGTDPRFCNSTTGQCVCDFGSGQCQCKAFTEGDHCDSCREGSFGLTSANPKGCTPCYCFGRAVQCSQAGLTWGQIRLLVEQRLRLVHLRSLNGGASQIEYVAREPEDEHTQYQRHPLTRLQAVHGLSIVPNAGPRMALGVNFKFPHPVYLELPIDRFGGDRVSSYGGALRIRTKVKRIQDGDTRFDRHLLKRYPLVQLIGHEVLILDYFDPSADDQESFNVTFHESLWRVRDDPVQVVSRQILMVALQRVTSIMVRATTYSDFEEVILEEASMDTAILIPDPPVMGTPAVGVELCPCPAGYNGSSCQDPALGYYRHRNEEVDENSQDPEATIVIKLVGESKRCECNGRSETCDKETGDCLNCRDQTSGDRCQNCSSGYHGDPDRGTCRPCSCPTIERNHAVACHMRHVSHVASAPSALTCQCGEGYTGRICEQCSPGYYGNALMGDCRPCECNSHGTLDFDADGGEVAACDRTTGACTCRPGVQGPRCDECTAERHEFVGRDCRPCDSCSQTLLDDIEAMSSRLQSGTAHTSQPLPLPWPSLVEFFNRSEAMQSRLTDYRNATRQLQVMKPQNQYDVLERSIEKSLVKASAFKSKAASYRNTAKVMKKDAKIYHQDDLKPTIKELHDIIRALLDYVKAKPGMSLKKALDIIKQDLAVIKAISLEDLKNRTRTASDEAEGLLEFLKMMMPLWTGHSVRFGKLRGDLEDFEELLASGERYEGEVKGKAIRAREMANNARRGLDELRKKFAEIRGLTEFPDFLVMSVEEYGNALLLLQDRLKKTLEALKAKLSVLGNFDEQYRDQYVVPSTMHAEELKKQSERIAQMFDNNQLGVAHRAAEVKANADRILQTVREIEDILIAVFGVLNSADEMLHPINGSQALKSRFETALLDSETLLETVAVPLRTRAEGLSESLAENLALWDAISAIYRRLNEAMNEIDAELDKLDVMDDYTTRVLTNKTEGIEGLCKYVKNYVGIEVKNITGHIRYEMRPKIQQIRDAYAVIEGDELTMKVDGALREYDLFLVNEQRVRVGFAEQRGRNATLVDKMKSLRDGIELARQFADGISITLTFTDTTTTNSTTSPSSTTAVCLREYAPKFLTTSSSNLIEFKMAVPPDVKNSGLVYLVGAEGHFLAVEMVELKIRMRWNLGGEGGGASSGELTHTLLLNEFSPGQESEDDWFIVSAERIANRGRLMVKKNSNNRTGVNYEPPAESSPGWTILKMPQEADGGGGRLWIGGVPERVIKAKRLDLAAGVSSETGLRVRLDQLKIDDNTIGLWNFLTSGRCDASTVGPSGSSCNNDFYSGKGSYSVFRYIKQIYRKDQFNLLLKFKTLDADGLLFLAIDRHPEKGRLIALTLQGGRVVFEVRYANSDLDDTTVILRMESHGRHNTGEWVTVDATRYFDGRQQTETAKLTVDKEKSIQKSPPGPVNSDSLPDINESKFYIGGVPPDFSPTIGRSVDARSLLAGFGSIAFDDSAYSSSSGGDALYSSYGVQSACSEPKITALGFHGDNNNNGYLELDAVNHPKKAEVSFEFRARLSEALLMLSLAESEDASSIETFTNGASGVRLAGYYSISLHDGRLALGMNTKLAESDVVTSADNDKEKAQYVLMSKDQFNDGDFHAVRFVRDEKSVSLYVDDGLQATEALKKHTRGPLKILDGQSGGMFFGGVSQSARMKLVASSVRVATGTLVGAVKNVVINKSPITFNKPVSFANVSIGRLGPDLRLSEVRQEQNTQPMIRTVNVPVRGCTKIGAYSLEPDAAQFGDGATSYAEVHLDKTSVWQKEYSVELDFRTFYPNGLLFAALPKKPRHRHHIVLSLQNGQLILQVRGKQRRSLQLPTTRLNDGRWHRVQLSVNAPASNKSGKNKRSDSVENNIDKKNHLNTTMLLMEPEGDLLPENIEEYSETILRNSRDVRSGEYANALTDFKDDLYEEEQFGFTGKHKRSPQETPPDILSPDYVMRIQAEEGKRQSRREERRARRKLMEQQEGPARGAGKRRGKGDPSETEGKGADSRKATLIVDGVTSAQARLPRKINVEPVMYVGGLSKRENALPKDMTQKLEGFKGCIRGLKVNGQRQDLVASGMHANVRQCFPQVERGSYFSGDSYAVYDEQFRMDKLLELQLDFRTAEMSGVLLSVSGASGKPALSLEVNNGKIIMSVDPGSAGSQPLVLEREIPSALCDNRWHNISAQYDLEELSIRVDQLLPRQRVRAPPGADMPVIEGPLYIGGLPYDASSGSLVARDNFKGCIRNVAIAGKLRDWTDMGSLHNVMLGSCPVSDGH